MNTDRPDRQYQIVRITEQLWYNISEVAFYVRAAIQHDLSGGEEYEGPRQEDQTDACQHTALYTAGIQISAADRFPCAVYIV
jgi:hypothetical protein